MGVVSPELFDAFPRRHPGMSVRQAIETGFEGVFVPLPRGGNSALGGGEEEKEEQHQQQWRKARVQEMLENLGPPAWTSLNTGLDQQAIHEFASKRFTDLSTGEQRIVLLMRALVGKPPVVLLDEVWSAMSEGMIRTARRYLRGGLDREQAVVVITHWEDEVPWSVAEGLKRFRLQGGKGQVVV